MAFRVLGAFKRYLGIHTYVYIKGYGDVYMYIDEGIGFRLHSFEFRVVNWNGWLCLDPKP